MFSTIKLLASILALAAYVRTSPVELGKRAQYRIVGYRTVPANVAQAYAAAGNTLTAVPANGQQLGQGVYTSPGIGDWPGGPTSWTCAILADEAAWGNLNKANVPQQSSDCGTLWYNNAATSAYLLALNPTWTQSNTILLSQIAGAPDKQQAKIPFQLLGSGGIVGLVTQCVETNDTAGMTSIGAYGNVDYSSWNPQGTQ